MLRSACNQIANKKSRRSIAPAAFVLSEERIVIRLLLRRRILRRVRVCRSLRFLPNRRRRSVSPDVFFDELRQGFGLLANGGFVFAFDHDASQVFRAGIPHQQAASISEFLFHCIHCSFDRRNRIQRRFAGNANV